MNDLISRSGLVAELETFKMSLGDVVLRFIVDRVIKLVKEFQTKEEPPAKEWRPPYYAQRGCTSCRHVAKNWSEEPCKGCNILTGWKNWELCE